MSYIQWKATAKLPKSTKKFQNLLKYFSCKSFKHDQGF